MDEATFREARECVDVAHEIGVKFLEGRDPSFQGAVLADLTARHFAGYRPEFRKMQIERWIDCMQQILEHTPSPWDETSWTQ